MTRRGFLAAAGATAIRAQTASNVQGTPVRLGVDIFSLRSQNWTPIQYLDYCARLKVRVVHFSEIRFLGNLEPANLRNVAAHARELGIEIEIGMKSICPSSKMFDPSQGTAEQQLGRMFDAAQIVGSKIVRAVLGSAEDRQPPGLERRIEDTVRVLRNVRSQAMDRGVKIAIENHAGDMQAWELKNLVEGAGPEFVGVCLDSGNPLWTLEDPHRTLDVLHPYALTSHVRDSAVWTTPQGAAVSWVVMGRGNVNIADYVKKYVALCPGRALSMETIVFGPRMFPYKDPAFWNIYHDVRAWEFERFVALAESGHPMPEEKWETADEAQRQRVALEESLAYTKKVLGVPA